MGKVTDNLINPVVKLLLKKTLKNELKADQTCETQPMAKKNINENYHIVIRWRKIHQPLIKKKKLAMHYRCFILNIFLHCTLLLKFINTTLHSYVNKCTTALENKNIFLPRCSCVGCTQTSTTQSFQTLAQEKVLHVSNP